MFFPGPGGGEGVLGPPLGFPTQLFVGQGRISPDSCHVTSPTRSDFIIEFQPVSLLEPLNQLHHGQGLTGTDIEYLIFFFHLAVKHPANGKDVSLGEIHDIYEIPLAGAVRGRIIVSEN